MCLPSSQPECIGTQSGTSWKKAEVVWSMTRTKTYLAAHYHRIARRKGKLRAVMAVAHSVLMIIYHMLKEKKPYEERGANYFDRLDAEQVQRYHVRRLEQLGYTVSLAAAGCFSEEGGGHLLAAPTVRFQFIEEHRQEYPVGLLCAALDVSLSGYCAWRKRPMSHQKPRR